MKLFQLKVFIYLYLHCYVELQSPKKGKRYYVSSRLLDSIFKQSLSHTKQNSLSLSLSLSLSVELLSTFLCKTRGLIDEFQLL